MDPPWGRGFPHFLLSPKILFFLWLTIPFKISESYDNPFYQKKSAHSQTRGAKTTISVSVIFGIAILKFNSTKVWSDKEIDLIVDFTTKLELILQSTICPNIRGGSSLSICTHLVFLSTTHFQKRIFFWRTWLQSHLHLPQPLRSHNQRFWQLLNPNIFVT